MTHCDKCGKNLALVGRRHDCVPRVDIERPIDGDPPIEVSAGQRIIDGLKDAIAGDVKTSTVVVHVCPTCGHRRPMTGAERQKAYRRRRGANSV